MMLIDEPLHIRVKRGGGRPVERVQRENFAHASLREMPDHSDFSQDKGSGQLRKGAVGLIGVLFLTVTGAAPLTAMLGNVPFAAGFGDGIHVPAAFLMATVVLTIFSVGYAAMADYIIGDPIVTPAGDADYYTETIAQLPFCYLPADTTWRPGKTPSRLAEGLPESGFVFCSLNGPQKYNPPLFDLWCRLLCETPGSVLWLSDHGANSADALRSEAVQRGVQPERLVFARRVDSKGDHHARIALADLGLDPFPYNSHSTGMDLLWAGVPLLALRGNTFAGRVGASMLLAAGLDTLVAETPEQYLEIASRLYRDRQELYSLRERLHEAKQSSPLFDMAGFARSLENIYTCMWENHLSGKRVQILADQACLLEKADTEIDA